MVKQKASQTIPSQTIPGSLLYLIAPEAEVQSLQSTPFSALIPIPFAFMSDITAINGPANEIITDVVSQTSTERERETLYI